jgi:hypothetical protein
MRGRDAQGSNVRPIFSDNHDVTHLRREICQKVSPELANTHPGAGLELEILRGSPVIAQTAVRLGPIDPVQRVAGAEEAVRIERNGCQIISFLIAWGDTCASDPRIQFSLVGNQFQDAAWHRQSDATDRTAIRVPMGGDRTGFGRPINRQPRHALADRRQREFVNSIAHMLRDHRA